VTYAAPEIFLGTPYDASVDIWSIGNIIHVMLVGFLPFDAEDKD
jgi:serine/threonine protein kinase